MLRVPDDTNVTPYIEPPPGYHQIDLQTFHTRGEPIENANFQTPGDAEYNGLSALLSVPLGPDGRPEQCVIVTTASARNVRGVDFATFQARTPHGVPGATARAKPALASAIYFNDAVIPDRSRTATSGDGGIIWTGGPGGRLPGDHREPVDPLRELPRHLRAGPDRERQPAVGRVRAQPGREAPRRRRGRRLGRQGQGGAARRGPGAADRRRHRGAAEGRRRPCARTATGWGRGESRGSRSGSETVRVPVAKSARRGRSRLTIKLVDGAGDTVSQRPRLSLPPPA